jgi:hypothetical protein
MFSNHCEQNFCYCLLLADGNYSLIGDEIKEKVPFRSELFAANDQYIISYINWWIYEFWLQLWYLQILLKMITYIYVIFVTDIDECLPSPCQYGTCQDLPNGYTCTCDHGYTGTNCEIGKIL